MDPLPKSEQAAPIQWAFKDYTNGISLLFCSENGTAPNKNQHYLLFRCSLTTQKAKRAQDCSVDSFPRLQMGAFPRALEVLAVSVMTTARPIFWKKY